MLEDAGSGESTMLTICILVHRRSLVHATWSDTIVLSLQLLCPASACNSLITRTGQPASHQHAQTEDVSQPRITAAYHDTRLFSPGWWNVAGVGNQATTTASRWTIHCLCTAKQQLKVCLGVFQCPHMVNSCTLSRPPPPVAFWWLGPCEDVLSSSLRLPLQTRPSCTHDMRLA